MRFLMMMIPAVYQHDTPADFTPPADAVEQMTKYNQELLKAGVMLSCEGLHPSSRGVRVEFSGSDRKVIDGPFAETKELLAGYWVLQVKSLDEAVEWVKRIPNPDNQDGVVEIRPVFESEDFGDELTPELRERDQQLRAQTEGAA